MSEGDVSLFDTMKEMNTMNILVIEPFGTTGHVKSNGFFLEVLSEIGSVTFATFSDYHRHFAVPKRIEIPEKYNRFTSKIGSRLNQMRVLSYIRRSTRMSDYDFTLFLCYDEIVLSLWWPKKYRTYIFEHNNIDKILQSRIKNFCFKHIGRNVIHLTYFDHVADLITRNYGREAYKISRPYHRKYIADMPPDERNVLSEESTRRKVIFAPSSGESEESIRDLISLASNNDGYYVIAKSKFNKNGPSYELKTYFDDYDEQMKKCDFVFFGGRYNYRGSGIVWEAFNFCKPAILLDCLLARELKKIYPATINPVANVADITALVIDYTGIYMEHKAFLQEHSFENIKKELSDVFCHG